MNYKYLLFLSVLTISFAVSSYGDEPECKTRETCAIGQEFTCNTGASRAYNRYFYFIFPRLQKGSHYECTFHSRPSELSLVLEQSVFPSGSIHTCQGERCPIFPVSLHIDTTRVLVVEDTMTIKYFVPASDIPAVVTTRCDKISA